MPTIAGRCGVRCTLAAAVTALLIVAVPGPAPAQGGESEPPPVTAEGGSRPADPAAAPAPAVDTPAPADPAADPPPAVTDPAPGEPLPGTAAGSVFGEWLEAFNSADENRLTAFIAARFTPAFLQQLPVDALVAFHVQTAAETGELAVAEVLESADERLRVHAQGTNGAMLDLTLEVEPEPPHRISGLRVVPAEVAEKKAAAPPSA